MWYSRASRYSGNLTIGTATLAAGLYVFTGNVTINGALTGTGVTLEINSRSLEVKPGNSSMNISAPLDGTYSGVHLSASHKYKYIVFRSGEFQRNVFRVYLRACRHATDAGQWQRS
jgi:hypothetical protein